MKILTPARVTLLMLFAIGGLIAAYVAKGLMASDEAPVKIETRAVPMAVADLKPGTVITEAHLGLGRMPVNELSDYPGMLLDNRGIVGRVVRSPIRAGTPILSKQLYQPGERPPLEVGEGMRAVSVALSGQVALVDGRIQPGQFVDVHMTPNAEARNDQRYRGGITLTLFKGVKVLAVNSGASGSSSRLSPSGSSNSVTLELTPGQANIIILAARRGEITLSYNPEGRGDGGVGVTDENRATLEEILGLRPVPRPPQPFVSETFKGSSRTTLQFQNGRRLNDTRPNGPRVNPTTQPGNSRQIINRPQPRKATRSAKETGPRLFPSGELKTI
ncbi:MAG: hypothetical protein Tsb009_33950 [Planctomycetaceae bacterium]